MKGFHILIDPSKQGQEFIKVSTIGDNTVDEHTRELAKQAIELHTYGHGFFRWDIERAILQVVNEQDAPDVTSVGDVEAYRENLIDEVTAAVEEIQAE